MKSRDSNDDMMGGLKQTQVMTSMVTEAAAVTTV